MAARALEPSAMLGGGIRHLSATRPSPFEGCAREHTGGNEHEPGGRGNEGAHERPEPFT